MDYSERNKQFKEKLEQVAALMEEMKVLANVRYNYPDSTHDDPYMSCNVGKNGDIYERIKEACKRYGIKINMGETTSDTVSQA